MFFTRSSAVIFLVGKIFRFVFVLIFLLVVFSKVKFAGGYRREQIILVYLIFSLINSFSQFLFREVYRFNQKILSGSFDKDLVRPISPLFTSLLGGADVLDLITAVLYSVVFFIFMGSINISFVNFFLFLLLVINSIFIAGAFHIFVLSAGVLTIGDNPLIMLYRDIENLGRIPVDFYDKVLRFILNYLVPIGIMMTFPAKVLFGLWNFKTLILSFAVSIIFFFLSLRFWRYALKRYSSASS